MTDYADRLKKIRLRIAISIAIYVVFALSSIALIVTGQTDYTIYLLAPLVASVLILPRFTVPLDFDGKVAESEKETVRTLIATGRWLTYTRGAYFLVALAILFGLPELLA